MLEQTVHSDPDRSLVAQVSHVPRLLPAPYEAKLRSAVSTVSICACASQSASYVSTCAHSMHTRAVTHINVRNHHARARRHRAHSAAVILIKVTTLTFTNLFYLTCRRRKYDFVNKRVATIQKVYFKLNFVISSHAFIFSLRYNLNGLIAHYMNSLSLLH